MVLLTFLLVDNQLADVNIIYLDTLNIFIKLEFLSDNIYLLL